MRASDRALMTPEEIEAATEDLAALARRRGRSLRANTTVDEGGGEGLRSGHSRARVQDQLTELLRQSLEDEVIATPSVEDGEIEETELSRELTKKALVNLKVTTLRRLAREQQVAVSGAAEEVAERVARALEWNEGEVAQLVLAHESEPSPERSWTSRLFPTAVMGDRDSIWESLRKLAGRYIRVGVARWFVFDSIDEGRRGSVSVQGSYRAYQASVHESKGGPSLQAVPHQVQTSSSVGAGKWIRVDRGGVQAAKATARALGHATGIRPLNGLPTPRASAVGDNARGVHPYSLLMLDMLASGLEGIELRQRDISSARFRVAEEPLLADAEDVDTSPKLRAVSFEGRHLLDSVHACRLISRDGRALVGVSLSVSASREGRTGRMPVRLALENDHITVTTGYGTNPEVAAAVHERLVSEVAARAVDGGLIGGDRLNGLLGLVSQRASEDAAPAQASMLADPEAV